MLLHLAQRIPRQLRDAHKSPRALERRQLLPASCFEFRCVARLVSPYHVRHRHFSAYAVGLSNDRYLRHFRLLRQEFLDLARIDVEPARYDQVAPPPAQRVIPVRGPPASIARPEPSVRERCPRRLNLPPIPMENVAPAQPHFTFFLAHYVAPIIVHNPHLNARQWQPDGPRAALPFIWIRNVHQRLG